MANALSKPKLPKKTASELAADEAKATELNRLKGEDYARKQALKRGQRGRASLLNGAETGVKETLG